MIQRTKEMREFSNNIIEILKDVEYLLEEPSKLSKEVKLVIIEAMFQRFLELLKEEEPACGVTMPSN